MSDELRKFVKSEEVPKKEPHWVEGDPDQDFTLGLKMGNWHQEAELLFESMLLRIRKLEEDAK